MRKLRWAAGVSILASLFAVTIVRTQEASTPTFEPATVDASVAPVDPVTAISPGTVVVSVNLDAAGEIENVKVIKSSPPFDSAALAAIKKWRFKPATLDGKPVPSVVPVVVSFAWPVTCVASLRN